MERRPAPLVGIIALLFASAPGATACITSRSAAPSYGPYPPYAVAPNSSPGAPLGPPPAPEVYRPSAPRQHAAAPLFLPGSPNQRLVRYAVVDGQAVVEGDILLGPVAQLPFRYGVPSPSPRNVKSAVALSNNAQLWPRSEIPFAIDPGLSPTLQAAVAGAVAHVNTTSLKVRPKTDADTDFVVFRDTGGGCSSFLGRVGGRQEIHITEGCGQGSVVHEILHAAGFFHEQSRGDRDDFVTVVTNEIAPGFEDQFDKRDNTGRDIGGYDFASIMHYSGRAFSRSGRPTIIPKVPGVTLGQREALSTLDRAAIEELYGSGSNGPSIPPPAVPGAPSAPPPAPPPPAIASGSFAGSYSSNRGDVVCSQNGASVTCQYPGGAMICAANGAALDCGWSGGGQGRAAFQRQPSGTVAGTFGDFLSHDSRGAWTLVPTSANGPASPPPAVPQAGAGGSLAGRFASTRGPMTCTESGASVACAFQETPGVPGRLDCTKDASGLTLACTWMTFFPPGSGRATFTRRTTGDRNLAGAWGHLAADKGGGAWEMKGQ